MSYVRTTVIDPNPGGSTRKQAILDLDTDTTGIFANLNTHEALTATHGATGAIVGTTNTQTLTNKTLTAPTLTTPSIGVASATSINKVAITAPATSATLTIADGKTLTAPDTLTLSQAGILALLNPTASRILGKKATGDSGELTGAEARAILGTSPFVLGSDADGDMYYRASSLLARLAKGTANYHLLMNSGATAPEWSKPYVVKGFTRDTSLATGDVSYTGFGFKPSAIAVIENMTGTPGVSIGWTDGITHFVILNNHAGNANTWHCMTTDIIYCIPSSGNAQRAVWKSFDTDGVTLTWTKEGTPTGSLYGSIFAWR